MATSRLIIVGDLFPCKSNLDLFAKGDIKTLFGDEICSLFAKADYRICNLEGTLTDGQGRCKKTGPVIKAPTSTVNAYKELGIDCCMLANNHVTDGNSIGVEDTMKTLEGAGIRHIGAGMNAESIPHYTTVNLNGKRVCIYNVSERMYNQPSRNVAGAWLYDEYVICKELDSLKQKNDHIIVIYHGGVEKFQYPSPETKKRFHRMADSGADVILSQHTHCIGCEEYYNGSYLLYGQGDFLFFNFLPKITDTGLIVDIEIGEKGLKVNKHKTKTVDFRAHYDEKQDLKDFEERSAKMSDEDYVFQQFQAFCKKELTIYLTAYKSPNKIQRAIRKFFPSYFKKWLLNRAFRQKDLLFALHTLRSEQNRETAIVGIEHLLDKDVNG